MDSHNKYKEKCICHDNKCSLFCYECAKFICADCRDPHFKQHIPSFLIDDYIREITLDPHSHLNSQNIAKTKQVIQEKYRLAEVALKNAFDNAIRYIESLTFKDETATKIINDMNLDDKAFQALKSLANENKQQIISETEMKDQNIENLFMKLSNILEGFSKMNDQFLQMTQKELNLPLQREIVPYYISGSNSIIVYDTTSKRKKTIVLNQSFREYSDTIFVEGRIFVFGDYPCSKLMEEIDLKERKFIKKEDMLVGKYAFGLCSMKQTIFTIGGYNGNYLDDCQKYLIYENKWAHLPNLPFKLGCSAAFSFNKNEVYSVGGHNGTSSINFILKINSENSKSWETINTINGFSARCFFHGIQINSNEVLIFGGQTVEMADSYILKMNENIECIKAADLAVGAEFSYSAAPIFDGKYVYGVDSARNIHIYSLSDKKWRLVSA